MGCDMSKELRFAQSMDMAFDLALSKALNRGTKPGNTWEPWKTFSTGWLNKRLDDEIKEYKEKPGPQELMDIINIAAFLLVQSIHKRGAMMADVFNSE